MKSLKAQLMAAIVMTLVAALTIGSSTYAWFTMNSTVSATGMQMKASSGGNVLIAHADNGTTTAPAVSEFKTTAAAVMDGSKAAVLSPTSTVNLQEWYKATAETTGAKAADSKGYTPVSGPSGTATDNGHYVKQTFYLLAGQPMDVYLSKLEVLKGGTAVPTTDKKIWNSLRIGVLAYDTEPVSPSTQYTVGSTKIFAQNAAYANGNISGGGDDTTAIGVAKDGDSAKIKTINTLVPKTFHAITTAAATEKTFVAAKLPANQPIKVEVFVWFEGEDGTCYTNNLLTDDLVVNFELTDVTMAK